MNGVTSPNGEELPREKLASAAASQTSGFSCAESLARTCARFAAIASSYVAAETFPSRSYGPRFTLLAIDVARGVGGLTAEHLPSAESVQLGCRRAMHGKVWIGVWRKFHV